MIVVVDAGISRGTGRRSGGFHAKASPIRSGNAGATRTLAAVITRIRPEIAELAIDYLSAMEVKVQQDADILKTAARLSQQFSHHLFDTLYHALAIHLNAVFVTADEKYYRKAETVGYIQLLSD